MKITASSYFTACIFYSTVTQKLLVRVEDIRMARENKKINVQTHVSKSIFCCISKCICSQLTGGPARAWNLNHKRSLYKVMTLICNLNWVWGLDQSDRQFLMNVLIAVRERMFGMFMLRLKKRSIKKASSCPLIPGRKLQLLVSSSVVLNKTVLLQHNKLSFHCFVPKTFDIFALALNSFPLKCKTSWKWQNIIFKLYSISNYQDWPALLGFKVLINKSIIRHLPIIRAQRKDFLIADRLQTR